MRKIVLIVMVMAATAVVQGSGASDSFTDSRDGTTYRTVRIGNKTWMAQNLNFQTDNSWCYEDNADNCQAYGRLYDWNTAMKVCPAGWRLPGKADLNNLIRIAGGETAGKKLKSKPPTADDTEIPIASTWNGTDDFGFSALPGGLRGADGSFRFIRGGSSWWAAKGFGDRAMHYVMSGGSNDVDVSNNGHKSAGNHVRCLQN